jgi:serine kinase of HPr protein (carbohydrate metabolism regulator)
MTIHATCICIGKAGAFLGLSEHAGVLLFGRSGAGKSDLALRFIARGAKLVADDRTELFLERGMLFARAPKTIAGLMEIRGVGIIRLPAVAKARIVLAVHLVSEKRIPRLPRPQYYKPDRPDLAPAEPIPLISLSADVSAPDKIVAAIAGFSRKLFVE